MSRIFFETPRLILREWQESDYTPYIALNADPQVMEFLPSVLTPEQTLTQIERISKAITENGYGFFAVERKDNGQFIGFTGLNYVTFEGDFTPCTEIGWRLSRESWGQGFATEAAKACLEFGFDKLGLNDIYAFTALGNSRSENVMKKIGMVKTGTFDHPLVADDSFMKKHLLYRIGRSETSGKGASAAA
ncbi:MAG: GNAT family N-acetyltransferase [Mucilaginibacter sp.]